MSPPSRHQSSDERTAVPEAGHADGVSRPSSVRITVVVENHYTFDSGPVTGRQIKDTVGVPAGFALYRRVRGATQPIPDDAQIELRDGDHFFARPTRSAS